MATGNPTARCGDLIDEREASRLTLRLQVKAHGPTKTATLTIRNLSISGFLAEGDGLPEEAGSIITCEFPNDFKAEARVVWADDGLVGVKFSGPLALSTFSAAILRAERDAEKSALEGGALHHTRISGEQVEQSTDRTDKLSSDKRLVIYILSCICTWTLVLAGAWYFLS